VERRRRNEVEERVRENEEERRIKRNRKRAGWEGGATTRVSGKGAGGVVVGRQE
jgi:hypothetical protein